MTSHGQLGKRLQQQIVERNTEVEKLTKQELEQHTQHLKEIVKNAKSTIEIDINKLLKRQKNYTKRAWIYPLIIGLSLFVGISLGVWGLTAYLSHDLKEKLVEKKEIEASIEQLKAEEMKFKRWEIDLLEDKGKKYVVFPKGFRAASGYNVGVRKAYQIIQHEKENK